MRKFKTTIIVSSLFFLINPVLTHAQNKDVLAYCAPIHQYDKHGVVDISSDHGVTIINKTGVKQNYHIYFDNAVQYPRVREMPLDYSSPEFTPNAHFDFELVLENGKRYDLGPVINSKKAYFDKKGIYRTRATTIIKVNNITIDNCVNYGLAEID